MPDTSAERTRDRALLRRVAGEVRPHWRGVAGIFLVDLAATPILLLMPVPLKIAVDSVIGSKPLPSPLAALTPDWLERSNDSVLGLVAGLLLAVVVLNLLQQAAAIVLRARTTERLTLAFRTRLFRRGHSTLPFGCSHRPTGASALRTVWTCVDTGLSVSRPPRHLRRPQRVLSFYGLLDA